MAVSLSALAGIGYAAAWIISLSVGAPNPSVAVSGVLLLIFVSATGIALRCRAADRPVRRPTVVSTSTAGTGIALAKGRTGRGP